MLALLPEWAGPVRDYMFHEGLPWTLRIAAFSLVGSAVVGIAFGVLLTLRFLPLRALIRLYVEVWRGLPIIVTIFLIYFALPTLHVKLDAFTAASVGLSLWGSAQVAEATRGAIQSVPREQHEAAYALGFGWLGAQANVIFPQALRRLIPPLVGILVVVIQNTTLAALIGVAEVLQAGQRSVERLQLTPPGNSHAFAIYAAVLVTFFVISFPLTRLAAYLEKRLV
jgi:polar amino acid transport system permease protein